MVRAIEAGAVGCLVACVALIPLLAYLFWKHEAFNLLTIAIVAVGCILGIVISWLRRPTPLASALLADQQLGLKELLSTAWVVRSSHTHEANVIQAAADHAARDVKASSVKVSSMTARGWGATVLAAIMAIVLCAMNPAQPHKQNATATATSRQSHTLALAQPDRPLIDLAVNAPGPGARPDPEDLNASRLGQNEHSAQSGRNNRSEANPSPNRRDETTAAEGRGGGAGRTKTATPPAPAINQASATPGNQSANGTNAGGSGTADNQPHPAGDGHPSAGVTSASPAANQAPPWSSKSWQDNVQRAQQAVSSGSVPAAYRDLVRGYFQSN